MIVAAFAILLLLGLACFLFYQYDKANKDRIQDLSSKVGELTNGIVNLTNDRNYWEKEAENNYTLVVKEQQNNAKLLSQKKSSETRLGQISEHLVPFLVNCPYDPKNLHFLGNPIDYIAFDFDEGAITFIEIKSGNSKPSERQRIIKNLIKSGRVFYDEIRINEKGVKVKGQVNE